MSLISPSDYEISIKALEHYIETYEMNSTDKMQTYALLNWIKLNLEKFKCPDNSTN